MSTSSPDKALCPACRGSGYHTMPAPPPSIVCALCGADIPDLDMSDSEVLTRQMQNTPCGHGWSNMTQARVPYVCRLCAGSGLLPANLHPINRDPFALYIQGSIGGSGGFQRWSPAMRDPDNTFQESPQMQRLLR
jgi:hypothetical protein